MSRRRCALSLFSFLSLFFLFSRSLSLSLPFPEPKRKNSQCRRASQPESPSPGSLERPSRGTPGLSTGEEEEEERRERKKERSTRLRTMEQNVSLHRRCMNQGAASTFPPSSFSFSTWNGSVRAQKARATTEEAMEERRRSGERGERTRKKKKKGHSIFFFPQVVVVAFASRLSRPQQLPFLSL